MSVNLSLFAGAGWQFFTDNGVPLSGGLLYTYAAGTTAPETTFIDNGGATQNTNPIILDAAGRPPSEIWLSANTSYKFVVKTSIGTLIRTYDNIPGANDSTSLDNFIVALANTSNIAQGDALVGFKQANANIILTGAVGKTVHDKLTEFVSVKDFGAVGDGVTDDTAAIQAALDAVINLGNANQDPKVLYFPIGQYLVTQITIGYITGGTGSAATKDAYYKNIYCDGVILGTNATDAIVKIEGALGCNFNSLRVTNLSTAVGSIAVKASRSYIVNWNNCRFKGGQYAHLLQGNLNNYYGCAFNEASLGGFAIVGNTANCVNNAAYSCDFEKNAGWGIYVNRTSGTPYADLVCRSCYFESNDLGHVRIYNNLGDVSFESCYLAMNDDLIDGIVIGGTLTSSTSNATRIENCLFYANNSALSFNCVARASGTAITAMGGIKYTSNVLAGLTNSNTVLGFTQAYSGSVNSALQNAINLYNQNRYVNIKNYDFSTLTGGAATAPTLWTAAGGTTLTSGTTISEYGFGNSIIIDTNYAYQLLTIRAYTLYEISYYAKTSAGTATAGVQIFNSALSSSLWVGPTTTSTTSILLTGYWFSDSNTSVNILLRKVGAGADTVSFSEVRMNDKSN